MSLCKVHSIHHTIYRIGRDLTCLDIHTNYHDPNKLYTTQHDWAQLNTDSCTTVELQHVWSWWVGVKIKRQLEEKHLLGKISYSSLMPPVEINAIKMGSQIKISACDGSVRPRLREKKTCTLFIAHKIELDGCRWLQPINPNLSNAEQNHNNFWI